MPCNSIHAPPSPFLFSHYQTNNSQTGIISIHFQKENFGMYTNSQLKVNSGRFKSRRDPLILFHSIFDQDEASQHYFLVNTKISIFSVLNTLLQDKTMLKCSTQNSKRCQLQGSLGQRDFAHIGLVMNKTFKGLLMFLNSELFHHLAPLQLLSKLLFLVQRRSHVHCRSVRKI